MNDPKASIPLPPILAALSGGSAPASANGGTAANPAAGSGIETPADVRANPDGKPARGFRKDGDPFRPWKPGSAGRQPGAGGKPGPEPLPLPPEYTVEQVANIFGKGLRVLFRGFGMDDPAITQDDLMDWAAGCQPAVNYYRQYIPVLVPALFATASLAGPRIARWSEKRNAKEKAEQAAKATAVRGEHQT